MTGPDQLFVHALTTSGLCAEIVRRSALSGGCIDRVERIDLRDGMRIVAKIGSTADLSRFKAEEAGLRALAATGTVIVPQPLACEADGSTVVLLMEFIEPGSATSRSWQRLGADLGALHQTDLGHRYGFERNNFLGTTPQINTWHANWVEFIRRCRYEPQINRAVERQLLTNDERDALDDLLNRLDAIVPSHPLPALLHGDLWSGNALPTRDERIAVIDPACSIGDGWADIAMMQLFGGFPESCFLAYQEAVNQRVDRDIERRILLYQLYHVLNHINIFGRGYASQMRSLIQALR